MIVAIDYFLLVGFCFAVTLGLFLGLKSIKFINQIKKNLFYHLVFDFLLTCYK